MQIFASAQEAEEAGTRDPASDFWFTSLGMKTAAGVRVTPETALTVSALFACVRIVAETVGSLPCYMYERLEPNSEPSKGKVKARNHPLYRLLRYQPNEVQTPLEFFEMLTGHMALRGWGYAEKIYNNKGVIEQLVPLHPDFMRVELMENGRLHYLYRSPATGIEYRYLPDEILHLRGFGLDPCRPLSVLQAAANSIGTAFAADDYAGRFFANDASPRGVLTHPSHFADKERRQAFQKAWQQAQTGANRHKTAVLEDGMKYEQLGVSAADAQLIESRRYQIADIARFFRMPLVLLGETEKSTSWGSGIEQFMLAFVTHTMRPWFVRWEQRLQVDLVLDSPETGDDKFFPQFLVDAILRGDMRSRFEAYSKGILDGHLTRNEARDMENRNPLDGLDEPLQPMNMQGANAPAPAPRRRGEQTEGDEVDARAAQVVRKEIAAITRLSERAVGRGSQAFIDALARFYGTHAMYVAEKLQISADVSREICAGGQRELALIASQDGVECAEITDLLQAWQDGRAREIALKVRRIND